MNCGEHIPLSLYNKSKYDRAFLKFSDKKRGWHLCQTSFLCIMRCSIFTLISLARDTCYRERVDNH